MSYVGEYRDRLRDGKGSYVFPGGCFQLDGSWKRGKMDGTGVFTLPDGGTYEGDFVNGEIEGIGLRRWVDGSTYNGQFHFGERHGEGVFIAACGEIYEGYWQENQRQGLGELKYLNGDIYRGEFHQHYPHGDGRLIFAHDGEVYDGNWVKGQRTGKGVLKNAKGKVLYDGEWVNNQREGYGKGVCTTQAQIDAAVIFFEGQWTANHPIAPTDRLQFKLHPEIASGDAPSQREFQNVPDAIQVEKKNGLRLPPLAVVSMHDGSQDNESTMVSGESGRRLRIRIFEGQIPTHETISTPPNDELSSSTPQWQFALPRLMDQEQDRLDEPTEEHSEVATEEPRVSEFVVVNQGGVAVFHELVLPESSLIGGYYLVCESLADDALPPVYLAVTVVE